MKMSEAKKLKPDPKRKLSDSARKRNKKAANALKILAFYITLIFILIIRINVHRDGTKWRSNSGSDVPHYDVQIPAFPPSVWEC
jgi:hypothetical protein